jgi:hypothetical protein
MLGTGAGSLFGLVTLEIFKGRGGYTYNPSVPFSSHRVHP